MVAPRPCPKWGQQTTVPTVGPDGKFIQSQLPQRVAEFSNRPHFLRIPFGHLSERFIVQSQSPGFQSRPRDPISHQIRGPPVGLECSAGVNPITRVDGIDQTFLNCAPMFPHHRQLVCINRDPVPLHVRHRGHVAAPVQCLGNVDCRHHRR